MVLTLDLGPNLRHAEHAIVHAERAKGRMRLLTQKQICLIAFQGEGRKDLMGAGRGSPTFRVLHEWSNLG